MAFADLTDAEHEAHVPRFESGLVDRGNRARVAHRRRFDGELLRERCAEKPPLLLRELDVGQQPVRQPLGVAFEHFGQVPVALAEAHLDVGERVRHLVVAEVENVGDDTRRLSLALAGERVPGDEELTEDPRRVRAQSDATVDGRLGVRS